MLIRSTNYTISTAITLRAAMLFLTLVVAAPARPQESQGTTESVAEAARNARERKATAAKHPKVITNDDLGQAPPAPSAPAFHLQRSAPKEPTFPLQSSLTYAAQDANQLAAGDCENPQANRLRVELEAAQAELDRLRRELSYQPEVISEHDLDLTNFRPGYTGFYVGAPPLTETQSPIPARVTEVQLAERVANLDKALHLACEPPAVATIEVELASAERALDLVQREFALDQEAYYLRPDLADNSGKAQLDPELEQIYSLRQEVERLKAELAAVKAVSIGPQ